MNKIKIGTYRHKETKEYLVVTETDMMTGTVTYTDKHGAHRTPIKTLLKIIPQLDHRKDIPSYKGRELIKEQNEV